MTVVLTRPQNAVSAVKLGYPVVMASADVPSGSAVIRWGNGTEPDKRGWPMVLNKKSVLELSTDKLEALRSMNRVVNTPTIYLDRIPHSTKAVIRPANHAEGSDFSVVTGPCFVPDGHHGTEFISPSREYRVWFVRGNYLVAKRVPRLSEGQSAEDLCRSKWGYSFVSECFPKLAEEMAKARTAIPLDFGAVDVLWKDGSGGQPGKYYFLEFNSAPSLDHDRVKDFFKTHLQAILRTVAQSEAPQVVPTQENAANRRIERPTAIVEPPVDDWDARYEAKLRAERKAKEDRIYKKVYGDV